MTLLLFLASLAVVNYIIGRRPAVERPETEMKSLVQVPERTGAMTPGLLALGEALERHGHGRTPQLPQSRPESDAAVHVKNVTH